MLDLSMFDPATFGYVGWSYPPIACSGVLTGTGGVIRIARIPLAPGVKTITNLVAAVGTAGATLTANQNLGAVFDNAGNLIGVTADQSTAWTSSGTATMPLGSGPFTGAWPWVYGALLANGTTIPKFDGGISQTSALNGNADSAHAPFLTMGSGQTAMPAALNATIGGLSIWMAVS
jgi:hypothetical protein